MITAISNRHKSNCAAQRVQRSIQRNARYILLFFYFGGGNNSVGSGTSDPAHPSELLAPSRVGPNSTDLLHAPPSGARVASACAHAVNAVYVRRLCLNRWQTVGPYWRCINWRFVTPLSTRGVRSTSVSDGAPACVKRAFSGWVVSRACLPQPPAAWCRYCVVRRRTAPGVFGSLPRALVRHAPPHQPT